MRAHVIEDGKVVNTIEVESLDFMPNLIDAAQDGKIGDLWDGARFSAAPKYENIDVGRSALLSDVNAECDRRMSSLVANYPEREQQTFPKQEQEARAFTADATAVTPMLAELALNRGIDKPTLASRIIAKADAFAAYSGKMIGYRQKLEDQINAASTVADLEVIDPLSGWPV